jgi:chromosome partitioning protein
MTTKIIAVISEKGGAGKTILAVNLAVAAEAHGLATVIFDLDPRANSTIWGDARPGKIPEVIPAQAPRLALLLEQAKANDADLVIIDTPGNAPDIAAKAADKADAILIPCHPDGPDLASIPTSVAIAQATGKPFYVVITEAPFEGDEVSETISSITVSGVNVAPVIIHRRKAFKSRFQEGLAAIDVEPKGKAAAEIREFFLWVCEKVIMLPKSQVTELTDKQA